MKVTERNSKESKAILIKDLTLLIDRLLVDGSLTEKMTLDEKD